MAKAQIVWKHAWTLPFLPLIVVAAAIARLVGRNAAKQRSAAEVVVYLENFLTGHGGDVDWDDFTSVVIADPALEEIRQMADMVQLPLTADGEKELQTLLEKALALAAAAAS